MRVRRRFLVLAFIALAAPAYAQELRLPVLVPLTGPLALEGTSQRNGALLAIADAPAGLKVTAEVTDTGAAPETAVTAFERALSPGRPLFVVAPIFGTQMLALLPLAIERRVPMLTISGTAQITEMNNGWVFRFFPTDAVVKIAHASYVAEDMAMKRPAVLYQTTAYGQGGREHLVRHLERLGAPAVLEEPLGLNVRDYAASVAKIRDSRADVVVLHLHAGPTAQFIRQARALGMNLPIVAGSAMHQPATAALLEPGELAGVCAETSAAPAAGGSPALNRFRDAYRARFKEEPDAFALAQYDAVAMALLAHVRGARTQEAMRVALATEGYAGIAMNYLNDANGDMAHDAVIVCYDGTSRTPRVVKRFPGATRR